VVGSTPLKKQSTEGNDRQAAIADPKPRNATSLSEAKRGLIDNQRQFRLLVESVDDYAIYMLDPNDVVASWNPGAERIKGYRRADVVGQPFELFFTGGRPHRRTAATHAAKGAHRRALRDRGLAPPQGRQPLLGQRRD